MFEMLRRTTYNARFFAKKSQVCLYHFTLGLVFHKRPLLRSHLFTKKIFVAFTFESKSVNGKLTHINGQGVIVRWSFIYSITFGPMSILFQAIFRQFRSQCKEVIVRYVIDICKIVGYTASSSCMKILVCLKIYF